MVQGNYKIRVKQGDVEIEIEGDKGFVIQTFMDARSMIWKEPVKMVEKTIPEIPKMEKKAPAKKEEKPAVASPVKAEPKKRGRKPGKALKKEEKPAVASPVKAEPKKRGRKPGKALKKEEKPAKAEKAPRKAKLEKPAKVEKPEKPSKKVRMDLKNKDFNELMKIKDPKNDSEKIIIAGYHLNKNERKREFKSNDVEDILKKFNINAPNNVSYYLRKLSDDKGLLTHGRKNGRYKVSDEGIKWIEYN